MQRIIPLFMLLFFTVAGMSQDPHHTTEMPLPCVNKTFQLYAFIVKDSLGTPVLSDSLMDEHIRHLNALFSPICISFAVCHKTYINDYSYSKINDEVEIGLITSRFQKPRRINVYFSAVVIDSTYNSFSKWNGITQESGASILVPANGRGLAHEMGHSFGLYHIFENKFGRETVDGKNCATAGDLICDTPAAPLTFPDLSCAFSSPRKDPNNQYYKTEVGNFMSHHFCAHGFFTREQYRKMATNYLNSPFKIW